MAHTRARGFVVLVAAGTLLAACGGGSSKATPQAPTTTKPPVAPSTPKQIAADKTLAKGAALALTDFPLGYTSSPHNKGKSDALPPAVERNFVACAHFPKRFLDDSSDDQPNADSPDFSKGVIGSEPAAQVQSSVEIDRSVKDISDPLSHLAAPGTVQCFDPLFRAVFAQALKGEPRVTLHHYTFRGLSVGTVGDQSAGFQGRVTIVGPRASLPVEFNLYFVRVGRSIVMLSANAFSVPFPQPFSQTLLEKMVGRLRAGLGTTE